MGRKRQKNKNLPPRVYVHHGSYRYVPKTGKRITLAKVGDYGGMLRALADVVADNPPLTTLTAVFDRYEREIVPRKAEATQKQNASLLKHLRAAFGHMQPGKLRAKHAARYRDARGKIAPTAANRELQLLGHVFTMALEWGAVDFHPLRGFRKLPMAPRDRYVTDQEYQRVHALARPMIACAMDLALLTGLRRGDILRLERRHLADQGIEIRTSKTGAGLIFEWSPALRQVVKDALAIPPQFRQWIICNRDGKQFGGAGFSSAWDRLMRKAAKDIEPFQFRDLRAKNASDEPELAVAQVRLGHTSPTITDRVYRRKAKNVKPLR